MIKHAQFPFPNPLGKPVGADQSFYWVASSACLAASWALAGGRDLASSGLVEVAVEHLQMRAQARSVGLAEPETTHLVPPGWRDGKPS